MRGKNTIQLIDAACDVLRDASNEGCDSDLMVVTTETLRALWDAVLALNPDQACPITFPDECDEEYDCEYEEDDGA